MNFFENFQKAVDTNLNVEFDSDVNIDLDLNKNVEINSDSLVDVTGNFGSLEFDVTAAGENGFAEASASVFVGPNLVEISGSGFGSVANPDIDLDPDPFPDPDPDPGNIFMNTSGNDVFLGTNQEPDIFVYDNLSEGIGADEITGFEPGLDEIRLNFNMNATLFEKSPTPGPIVPSGERVINDDIFFGEDLSGAFKIVDGTKVQLIFPSEGETVTELGTNNPLAQVNYNPLAGFQGGTISIKLLDPPLEPDNLVFLSEM